VAGFYLLVACLIMFLFRFCVLCGTEMAETKLPTEDRPRLVCVSCGYIHYINPKLVCGTLPVENGSVWLLRRGIEPRLGYWSYPAGFQEWDESSEEAACRETKEEIGCDVRIESLFGVYSSARAPIVNVVYLASLLPTSPSPSSTQEAIEVRSFRPENLPWADLAFPSTEQVLKDWVRNPGKELLPGV
jgi:ADP-ribose pyrophosphatase YjhB (NUDIX family)